MWPETKRDLVVDLIVLISLKKGESEGFAFSMFNVF
jgi:hypothetical protein